MSDLPILYRSERGTGDWLAVPRRCPACRGNLAEDVLGDVVSCVLCARPVAEVRDARPPRIDAAFLAYDDAVCTVEDCVAPRRRWGGRGLCNRHYVADWRARRAAQGVAS